MGRNRLGQPDVTANDRIRANYGFASKYGGPSVDDDVVFDGRVPLFPSDDIAGFILWKTQGADRDALIELHVVTDIRGFADHHAGAVIDEETLSDLGARVDIDPGSGMRILGHDARQKRDADPHQLVRNSEYADGVDRRISEYDFIRALGRGISVVA